MSEARVAAQLLRWTVEMKLDAFIFALERRYAPDQPRVPAGSPDGGQWTIGSGSGSDTNIGRSGNGGNRSTQIALAGRLEQQRLSHMEGTYFWMCNYRDMLGRGFGFSLKITMQCPPTFQAPPATRYEK